MAGMGGGGSGSGEGLGRSKAKRSRRRAILARLCAAVWWWCLEAFTGDNPLRSGKQNTQVIAISEHHAFEGHQLMAGSSVGANI